MLHPVLPRFYGRRGRLSTGSAAASGLSGVRFASSCGLRYYHGARALSGESVMTEFSSYLGSTAHVAPCHVPFLRCLSAPDAGQTFIADLHLCLETMGRGLSNKS